MATGSASSRRSVSGRAAETAQPTVLFIESHSWEAFSALAGALRNHGVRIAHVVERPVDARARVVQTIDRALFGKPLRLVNGPARPGEAATLDPVDLASVLGPNIVDVQAHDDLLPSIAKCPSPLTDPASKLGPGVDPAVLSDKWVVARICREAEVPTPAVWAEPTSEHFPVIVKTRVGFAGIGVSVVKSPDELISAWDALTDADGQLPFMQQFLGSGLVDCGGVAKAGEVLVLGCFEPYPDASDPTGPSQVAESVDSPIVDSYTRKFIDAIGYTGFFNIDWALDSEGIPHLIDFNARVFGSWPALQACGIDFIGAYLYILGLGPKPTASGGLIGQREGVLRFPLPPVDSLEALRHQREAALHVISSRKAWLGNRWAGVSRVKLELSYFERRRNLSNSGSKLDSVE